MGVNTKDAELLTSAVLMGSVKLIKDPHLITIKTISPKVVEQLPWFDSANVEGTMNVRFDSLETVGLSEKSYSIVVRRDGQLGKIRPLNFLMWLRTSQHVEADAAQGILRALPQLFEV